MVNLQQQCTRQTAVTKPTNKNSLQQSGPQETVIHARPNDRHAAEVSYNMYSLVPKMVPDGPETRIIAVLPRLYYSLCRSATGVVACSMPSVRPSSRRKLSGQ